MNDHYVVFGCYKNKEFVLWWQFQCCKLWTLECDTCWTQALLWNTLFISGQSFELWIYWVETHMSGINVWNLLLGAISATILLINRVTTAFINLHTSKELLLLVTTWLDLFVNLIGLLFKWTTSGYKLFDRITLKVKVTNSEYYIPPSVWPNGILWTCDCVKNSSFQ